MEEMIEKAQEKIKATADAMLQAQHADMELEKKIGILNEFESNKEQVHQEDNNIQNHLQKDQIKGMSRQERIANIVNEIVAQNTDLDLKEESDNEEDEQKGESDIEIENQNTLMAFTDKGLEPIKEQITEEFQASYTEENNQKGPDKNLDVEKIFETQKKPDQNKKFNSQIEDTPIFGEGEKEEVPLFTRFL